MISATMTARRKRWTVNRPEQIAALRSSQRERVCDVVYALGQATVQEIAEQLGARPTAVYRHLRILCDVDLIEEGPAARTVRNFARTYRAKAERVTFLPLADDPKIRALVADVIESELRMAAREYRIGIESERERLGTPDTPIRSMAMVGWLGRKERIRVNQLFEALMEMFDGTRPGPGKSLQALTFVSRPAAQVSQREAKS